MKKLLPIITVLLCLPYAADAQIAIYWRGEAPNGNWEWGSTCDAGSDGSWYYPSPWNGFRKRPDCYGAKYIHFDNNNQTTMNLNSSDDFSAYQILFDGGATVGRTISTSVGRKIFFKAGAACKIENYSTATHTISPDITFENSTEFNPINGSLTLNGTITTAGNAIYVYGPNAKTLTINGVINGSGSLTVKQNSIVQLNAVNTYTGATTVEAGTLQLNNNSGALPATASVTVNSGATLKISKNQTLASVNLQSGGTLVIDSGAVLTLTGSMVSAGTITNNGTLKLNVSGSYTFPGSVSITAMNALEVAAGTVSLGANITPASLTLSGGTLDLGNYTANGSGTLTLSSGTLKIGGTNTLPSGYATYSINSANTVEYYGTTQTIAAPGSQKYGNLVLSGSGQKKLGANVGVANNATVNNGTSLLIESLKSLTVDNRLINNGNATAVTIQNNGALVQTNNVSNTGQITQYKNSNNLYRFDYTLWSAPVSGQNLLAFSPQTVSNRFYEYRYGTNSAGTALSAYFHVDASANSFTPGKGYLIRMPDTAAGVNGFNTGSTALSFNGTFAGTPNNGTITVPLSTNGDRFTSIGNPYPSPISVSDFFSQNSSVIDSNGAIYLWRKRNATNTSSYATLTLAAYTANGSGQNATNSTGGQNASGFFTGGSSNWLLAPGQGFLVQTKSGVTGSPVATFTNSMRRIVPGAGTAFLRTTEGAISRMWINISNSNTAFSQAALVYMPGATTGNDFALDGKRFTESGIADIYTLSGTEELAVQARPDFIPADVVPLGFTAPTAGNYTINLDRVEGVFNNGQAIYLVDTTEGIVRNLTDKSYEFTTEAGTFNNRFELRYTTAALSVTNNNKANAMVYVQGGNLNVSTQGSSLQQVTVYDLNGRLVQTQNACGTTAVLPLGSVAHQVLIAQIITDKGTISKKIIY